MKRIYHILALLALVNLFTIGGLVGYLFASGKLNAERVDQIAMVLRGEFPETQVAASQPTTQQAPPESSQTEIAKIEAQKEYLELVAERRKHEIEYRKSLDQGIQLEVLRTLENIEKKERELEEQRKKMLEENQQLGSAQVLEMLSSSSPELAKNILQSGQFKEADVIQLLIKMDENRRKKIINSCKEPEEQRWIGRILNQIHNVNEPAVGEDGSNAPSK